MKRNALIPFLVLGIACLSMPVFAQEAKAPAPEVPAVTGGEDETDIVAGKVQAVDAANSTLTVTDEAGKSYTLTATKEETSIWKGDDTVNLSDVKSQDSIELEYYKKDDKLIAIWIDVLTKEAAAPAEVAAPAPAPAPAQ